MSNDLLIFTFKYKLRVSIYFIKYKSRNDYIEMYVHKNVPNSKLKGTIYTLLNTFFIYDLYVINLIR